MASSTAVNQIGAYAIDAELGRGSFGVVYRAHHVDRPDETVALKIVEGRGHLDRLMLEPALLAQLDHPCIVGIEDYFRFGDRLVLILEFIKGEDLKSQMDRGETFSQEMIRDFLVQMAGALATAHARQIIHRDLKPSNILVAYEGGSPRFVLTDFGIGQRVEGVQDRKHTGGTYSFMAPEQLRGRPGPQSDLWALGVVAYRMLTGKQPFPGPSLPELAQQIMYVDPPPPSQVCSEPVDPELEKIIAKLLDKSLQERVSSAEELLRLLDFRGEATEVLSQTTIAKRPKPIHRDMLDRQLARSIRWRKIWLIVLLAIYVLPGGGLIPPLVRIAGFWFFYKSQADDRAGTRRVIFLAAALFFIMTGAAMMNFPSLNPIVWAIGRTPAGDQKAVTSNDNAAELVSLNGIGLSKEVLPFIFFGIAILVLCWVLLVPAWAAYIYVGLRRRQREKVLRDAALSGGTGSDRFLDVLRSSLDYRFADVGFHLKYAEALVARGRHADAAVEARLILQQDPYNFSGNVLLANAYYTLGLRDDCAAVCDAYLDVSGYCFEFAELRDLCQRKVAKT